MAAAARYPWWIWAILAVFWFGTISLRPLLEPDEGRYAEIPREMLASGDWVTPRLNDLKYFEKPPLQYWATAAVYSVFGVKEWTSRAYAFLLAFLCLPMAHAFARRAFESADVAAASVLALAVNPAFAVIGRINLLDSAFTFFLSAALFAILVAMRSEPRSPREHGWMLAMWASLGLAMLTKGLAAPVLCGATLVIYSLFTRQWQLWLRLRWISGLALFAAITVPWFVVVARRNPEFLHYFFIHEHFQRFATDVSSRPGPWWYFLPFIAVAVAPWAAVLWRQRGTATQALLAPRDAALRVDLFLLIWIVVVTVFFSASQSKLVPYVMPAMPALAVLLAPLIARDPRSTRAATWWVAGSLGVFAVALLVYARRYSDTIPTGVSVSAAGTVIAVTWLVFDFVAWRRREGLAQAAWRIAAVSVLGWSLIAFGYSIVDRHPSTRDLVNAMRPHVGAGTQLFSVGQYRQTVAPYLGRTLRLVNYRGDLDFGLSQEVPDAEMSIEQFIQRWEGLKDGVAVIAARRFADLEPRLAPFVVVARDRSSVVIKRR